MLLHRYSYHMAVQVDINVAIIGLKLPSNYSTIFEIKIILVIYILDYKGFYTIADMGKKKLYIYFTILFMVPKS